MKSLNAQMMYRSGRLVVGLLIFCFFAFSVQAKQYTLTFATQHPAQAPMNRVVNTAWTKWIHKASKGRLKIVQYPAEQIAKAPNLYDAAMNGLADISCMMLPFNPGRWPLTEVTMLPFLYEFPASRAAALTAMALYDKYPEIQAEHRGVKVIGFHATGPFQVHTIKKPIYKMEDLKGELLNISGKIGTRVIKLLGGTPESLFPSEQYDAAAKGVITGNVLEWEGQFIWHMNELTRFSTQVNISIYVFVHIMNLDTWNSLPPDLQALIGGENGKLFHTLHGYNFDRDDIMFKGMLDKQYKKQGNPGVYILPPKEKARWVKAIQPVLEEWVKDASKKVGEKKAREILADAQKFGKKFGGYPDVACPYCGPTLKSWSEIK